MIKAFDDYTLLAGSHGRRGSIWRGPDHLLIVEGAGALYALNESYRRIDYENIQALSLVRTQRYGWLLAAFVAPMAIAALILMVIIGSGASVSEVLAASMIFGLPLVLIPFVLLVVHLARGRTVRCTLQTAVQSLRLRPLTREAWARSVIAQIAEICRSHQNVAESPPPPVVSATSWQAAPVGPLPVWSGSPVIITAAVIVFLWGAVLAGELFVGGAGYLVVDLFLGLIATLAAIVALVVAMRHQSPTGLQAMLWATSGMGVLIGFCSLVYASCTSGFSSSGVPTTVRCPL